jgi:hypothetical protein
VVPFSAAVDTASLASTSPSGAQHKKGGAGRPESLALELKLTASPHNGATEVKGAGSREGASENGGGEGVGPGGGPVPKGRR